MNTNSKYVTSGMRERVFRALSVHRAGISVDALRLDVSMTKTALAATLRALRADEYADYLPGRGGAGVWGTWHTISRLRKQQVEESRKGRMARQTAARRARRGFDKDTLIMAVPDMPVRQVRVSTWTPVRVPPGPVSVFNLGAQHA